MATRAEVRKRALIKLGRASLSQTPESYLDADMVNAYNEVYRTLQEMDLVYWGQTSDVPDEVANHVATLMAWFRVNDYGVSAERHTRLAVDASSAESRIRMMAVSQYRSVDEPEDF